MFTKERQSTLTHFSHQASAHDAQLRNTPWCSAILRHTVAQQPKGVRLKAKGQKGFMNACSLKQAFFYRANEVW